MATGRPKTMSEVGAYPKDFAALTSHTESKPPKKAKMTLYCIDSSLDDYGYFRKRVHARRVKFMMMVGKRAPRIVRGWLLA